VVDELDLKDRQMRELEEARIRLDKEIQTYRILLQEEENRLHAQPTAYAAGSPGRLNRKKRKVVTEPTVVRITETTLAQESIVRAPSPRVCSLVLTLKF
jgi:hypothetical protein